MTTRADVVLEARRWLDTPYRHQARKRGVAVDCVGLIGGVALALGMPGAAEWMEDRALHNYARTPDPALLLAACARFFDPVPTISRARAGDVLLFTLAEQPRHFALVSETRDGVPFRIIHAYALLAARRVVEQSLPVANAKVVAAYSFRGIDA